jgi:YidC/Oxa1 family membrane protein insertase
MISDFFNSFIYEPLYNALAFIVSVVPGGDLGVAIIVLTLLVRLLPKLQELREKLKDNKEELARQTMALFKEHKVNPFASIFLVLLQIPVILGLYFVFLNEGAVGSFDPALLYSFVPPPETVSSLFLGLIDLTGKSLVLAILVAVSQFFYARLTMTTPPKSTGNSFRDDMARSMNIQMRYVFPIIFGFIAYVISAAVALYFVVSNIFGIVQTLAMKKKHHGQGKDS